MKKILIIAIAALAFSTAGAQNPDAVYKLLRYDWTVNADGTSDYHYRHEVQILRNRALTAYADKGETFVTYNPDMEALTINEVYTIQHDGTRVDMPQNAFIYQLPSQCADCGRFNHIRELAMVHTGMEIGCTIVVDYTIHRRYDLVSVTLPLMKECPVEHLEVNVTVPEGHDLNVTLSNPKVVDVTPNESRTQNSYRLSMDNLPQTFSDSYLPAPAQLYPILHFYNGVPEFTPAFNRDGLAAAGDVAGMVMQSGDARKNIASIRDFVVDNIHLNDLPPAMLGYTHTTAAQVWQSGCGTPTDKAVLLAAMLNEMGFNAQVSGDDAEHVSVVIDTLEYRLSVRHKGPAEIYGEAKDEVNKLDQKATLDPEFDTLEDGFFHLLLQKVPGSPAVDIRNLSLARTAPLQSTACNLQSDITYTLPKGMKMVGDAIEHSLNHNGIGHVSVQVKQSGKKLRVVRRLVLDKSVIPASEYARYRQLLAIWQGTDKILMQNK